MSLATYVTREVAEKQAEKRRAHLSKLGLDPDTADAHVDEQGQLKRQPARPNIPVQAAIKQAKAAAPRRFGGPGAIQDAPELHKDHRNVSNLQDVMRRSAGGALHPNELDIDVVGGFDRRGRPIYPDYLTSLMGTSAQDAISDLNPEVAAKQQLVDDTYKESLLKAKMPPGLQAARDADAAKVLSKARSQGRVGRTTVRSTAEDRKAAVQEEKAEFDKVGERVNSLVAKLGALSGQMETIQYGAMLKPAFGVMAKVMNKIGAGPKGSFDPAGDLKERQRQFRKGHLLGNTVIPEEDTVHRAYGPSGGLGATDVVRFEDEQGSHFVQPKPKPLSPRSQVRARRVRPSDMLDNLW
jgi:hypothetical protein